MALELTCDGCTTRCDRRRVLRSTSWDGPVPKPRDVLREGEQLSTIEFVLEGPGLGHYTMVVCRARVVEWRGDR